MKCHTFVQPSSSHPQLCFACKCAVYVMKTSKDVSAEPQQLTVNNKVIEKDNYYPPYKVLKAPKILLLSPYQWLKGNDNRGKNKCLPAEQKAPTWRYFFSRSFNSVLHSKTLLFVSPASACFVSHFHFCANVFSKVVTTRLFYFQ